MSINTSAIIPKTRKKDASSPYSATILIAGGQSSGKKTASNLLKSHLEKSAALKDLVDVQIIELDNYLSETYTNTASTDSSKANESTTAADAGPLSPSLVSPTMTSAFSYNTISLPDTKYDFKKLKNHILQLSENYRGYALDGKKKFPIFIVHGLYALYDRQLNHFSSMKIFIDIDADTRLVRWIKSDTLQEPAKQSLEQLINNYLNYSRMEFSEFILPTRDNADIILTRGAEVNDVGVNLISDGIIPIILDKIKNLDTMIKWDDKKKPINKENKTEVEYQASNVPLSSKVVSGVTTLNIKAEQFNGERSRYYDLN